MDPRKLQRVVVDALDDIKAQDIRVFDTTAQTELFDRVIIATGTSNRQTRALASHVRDKVKEAGAPIVSVEGTDTGEWVLVDLGDIVVHVMQPAIRQYYNLEELWGAKPVRLRVGERAGASGRSNGAARRTAAERSTAASEKTATKRAAAERGGATTRTAAKAPAEKRSTAKRTAVKEPATETTAKRGAAKATPEKATPVKATPAKATSAKATPAKAPTAKAPTAGAAKGTSTKRTATKQAPTRRAAAKRASNA